MTFNDIASIATIAEATFVIISVHLIRKQIQENVRLTKIANSQHLVDISSPFNLQLIQDRFMAQLWVSGAEDYQNMDSVDKYRYHSLLTWWLILQENIFFQHSKGLLDSDSYAAWNKDLDVFIKEKKLWLYWDEMKSQYQPSFVSHVDILIEKHKPKSTVLGRITEAN